jgi:hypothetical protein
VFRDILLLNREKGEREEEKKGKTRKTQEINFRKLLARIGYWLYWDFRLRFACLCVCVCV